MPEPGNPQALNRYACVRNNLTRYNDPSGHCWDAFSFIRQIPTYDTTCNNLDMAFAILESDQASPSQKALAGAYIAAEGGAHLMLVGGTAILAGEGAATLLSGTSAVEAGGATAEAAVTSACADGDCTNEVESVTHVFWSGGEMAKNAAQEWALHNGGVTLEMTPEGQYLEAISRDIDWLTEARPLWEQASRDFALRAQGDVHVFQVAERGVSLQSIWATVEYPTLLSNPQVEKIIYHVIMSNGDIRIFR